MTGLIKIPANRVWEYARKGDNPRLIEIASCKPSANGEEIRAFVKVLCKGSGFCLLAGIKRRVNGGEWEIVRVGGSNSEAGITQIVSGLYMRYFEKIEYVV